MMKCPGSPAAGTPFLHPIKKKQTRGAISPPYFDSMLFYIFPVMIWPTAKPWAHNKCFFYFSKK
jgi:hypothetical protein